MMAMMKVLMLTALFGVGAALPHTMGAPGCEEKVEQLKEQLDAAVTTLDSLNAQYARQVASFNARTDAAQAEIDAANTAYEQALQDKNTQQDKTFKARDEFNIAALRLSDTVQLCNQPQPPSTCANDLTEAKQAVKHANATMESENAKLVTADAALDSAYEQQQMAEAAYESVVELQDKEIGRMQDQIGQASGAVQEATAAWQSEDQSCHAGGGRRHVR